MFPFIYKYFRLFKIIFLHTICIGFGGCTTIVAGKKASAYGSVLIGHNEDNQGKMSALNLVPRLEHAKDAVVELNGGGMLEQADTTWSYLWSEIPGQTFCDFYLNEWGVIVTSNSATSKERDIERLKHEGRIENGGIDYWLRRIVAERARNAREGLDLAADLLDMFGYTDTGRMYTIADYNEAWILHVIAGKEYCARRLPDDEVAIIPNAYILDEIIFDDSANYVFSSGIREYAIKMGWYDGKEGGAFRFNRVFGAEGEGVNTERGFDYRQWSGQKMVKKQKCEDAAGPLPFSVKPDKPVDIAKVKQILRSHHEEMPFDSSNSISPHFNKERCICFHDTKESIIIQLRKGFVEPAGAIMWRALCRPCFSIYIPFYLGAERIPADYGLMDYEKAIKRHFNRETDDNIRPDFVWNIFYELQNHIDRKYAEVHKKLEKMVLELEEEIMERVESFERDLVNRYAVKKPGSVSESLSDMDLTEKIEEPGPFFEKNEFIAVFVEKIADDVKNWASKALFRCESDPSFKALDCSCIHLE